MNMHGRRTRALLLLAATAGLLPRPSRATASPVGCPRAIERGQADYLKAMLPAVVRCAASAGSLDCLDAIRTDPTLVQQRVRWSKRTARACAGTALGGALGYYDTCHAEPVAGRCAFPTTAVDVPGDDNDLLDCLTCQMRERMKEFEPPILGHQPANALGRPEDLCARALAGGGLAAFQTIATELGRCLKLRRGTSITVCRNDPKVAAKVDAALAAWRARAITQCAGVDPFATGDGYALGYPRLCNGPQGTPGQFSREVVPSCTFPPTSRLDGPGGADDLLDCLQCEVEETALGLARDAQGANLCCTPAGCGVVMTRAACQTAHGHPVYYRIDDAGVAQGGSDGVFTPHGMSFTPDGVLYLGDLDALQGPNGRVVTVAPDLATHVVGTIPLFYPTGIAVDAARNAYVSTTCHPIIYRMTPAGDVSPFVGNATPGHSGDGGPAADALIAAPRKVATDAAGNVYFTESGFLTLGCGGDGVVLDHEHVRSVDPAGSVHTLFGAGEYGTDGEGGPAATALLAGPISMHLAMDGSLLLGEGGAQRVVRIRPLAPDGILTRVAGVVASAIGAYAGDGGPALRARFFDVEGIVQDADGNVIVSDYQNYRVRLIDTAGSIITIAGNGVAAGPRGPANGDGGPGVLAFLGLPQELALAPDGKLWFLNQVHGWYLRTLTRVPF